MLGIILTSLIAGSIQYVAADHTRDDNGIFKGPNDVNVISTKDSKYNVHLLVIVRDSQGQLVSVSESKNSKYIPHAITDFILDNKLDKKEILLGTLSNIERPAICTMIPTANNFCVMLDLGANKDCNEK